MLFTQFGNLKITILLLFPAFSINSLAIACQLLILHTIHHSYFKSKNVQKKARKIIIINFLIVFQKLFFSHSFICLTNILESGWYDGSKNIIEKFHLICLLFPFLSTPSRAVHTQMDSLQLDVYL